VQQITASPRRNHIRAVTAENLILRPYGGAKRIAIVQRIVTSSAKYDVWSKRPGKYIYIYGVANNKVSWLIICNISGKCSFYNSVKSVPFVFAKKSSKCLV